MPLPNDPPTIYTVAEHAGVSVATVSRVLQNSPAASQRARDRVNRAVAELGYQPLRPRTRRPQTLGLVVPTLTGPEPAALLLGMQAEGQARMVLSCDGIGDQSAVDEQVTSFATQTDALVVWEGTASDVALAGLANQQPVVLVGGQAVAGCDRFEVDQTAPITELVDGLVKLGRSRLVFVGDPTASGSLAKRYTSFTAALMGHGLREASAPIEVSADASGADLALPQLLDLVGLVDAAVCASDDLALRLLHVLVWRQIRVPEDLAVTGWGDQPGASYVVPRLTTVVDPSHELGRLAADRLRQRLTRRSAPATEQVLTPEVRWRESTGRP